MNLKHDYIHVLNYQVIQRKKEEWLKSLKLEEDKILDSDEE